jgi:hypothetical protein
MTYTAPAARAFRERGGDLDTKITEQLALIDTELDTDAAGLAGGLKVAKVAIAGGAENAFCLAWQNPEAAAILIEKIIVRIGTPGVTASAVLNFGTGATATTASDNLIDGADATATAGTIYDNITDKGSNGKTNGYLDAAGGTTDYITGQILAAAAAALVGKAYIFYTLA